MIELLLPMRSVKLKAEPTLVHTMETGVLTASALRAKREKAQKNRAEHQNRKGKK